MVVEHGQSPAHATPGPMQELLGVHERPPPGPVQQQLTDCGHGQDPAEHAAPGPVQELLFIQVCPPPGPLHMQQEFEEGVVVTTGHGQSLMHPDPIPVQELLLLQVWPPPGLPQQQLDD